jgi:hypothetical protein
VNRIALEVARYKTFAVALDWPGWCRAGKTPDDALEALSTSLERYRNVLQREGPDDELRVVGEVAGDGTTDFGAPAIIGPWDSKPLTRRERERLTTILEDCWAYFDRAAAAAPDLLRKGPRGGGRDRLKMMDHVRNAERAYASRLGAPVPPRTPWPAQRATLSAVLRSPRTDARWPTSYGVRRVAWHVLDHAWELEDRGNGPLA